MHACLHVLLPQSTDSTLFLQHPVILYVAVQIIPPFNATMEIPSILTTLATFNKSL